MTPYGAAKACAHYLTRSYRERYGLFACSGILYNHESERRPPHFLPRKVARAAAAISLGLEEAQLHLGDLNAHRDWGYARDYVEAMWLMLQQPEPGDYVVATGVSHSVGELVECAFEYVGLDWRDHVVLDPSLDRGSSELHDLVGDASKARTILDWRPSVSFEELIRRLVEFELALVRTRAEDPEGLSWPGSGGASCGHSSNGPSSKREFDDPLTVGVRLWQPSRPVTNDPAQSDVSLGGRYAAAMTDSARPGREPDNTAWKGSDRTGDSEQHRNRQSLFTSDADRAEATTIAPSRTPQPAIVIGTIVNRITRGTRNAACSKLISTPVARANNQTENATPSSERSRKASAPVLQRLA